MIGSPDTPSIAFQGSIQVGAGPLFDVALAAHAAFERDPQQTILIFDEFTSHQLEVDLRGSPDEVGKRVGAPAPPANASPVATAVVELHRGPGRPRLGVVAREITLLPRHWQWLGNQPGGASVALRRLVDEAKKANETKDRARVAQESAYRFMSAMAGNEPGFEEATRAFFANNSERFEQLTQNWPPDVMEHSLVLASRAFGGEVSGGLSGAAGCAETARSQVTATKAGSCQL